MPRTIDDDELMTVAQVAAILKLNQQTIRNWIDDGRLPCVRIGERRVRVWRSDFQAMIDSGNPGSRSDEPFSIWDAPFY